MEDFELNPLIFFAICFIAIFVGLGIVAVLTFGSVIGWAGLLDNFFLGSYYLMGISLVFAIILTLVYIISLFIKKKTSSEPIK